MKTWNYARLLPFEAMRALAGCVLLTASSICFAQPGDLAAKLAAGSPWRVSATIPGFVPFTWSFRLSADGKLERRNSGEWREQEIRADNTTLIQGRDGTTYTIGLDGKGELTLDRTNLRGGARVSIESGKK